MVDGSLRILVVEDNPPDVLIIQELLAETRGQRWESTAADRLRDALEVARRHPFDVILLDLGLPDSAGLESLIRLRREVASLPVIVLTHLDDEELALRAAQYGAHDYLVKGQFTGAELMRSIRYALERRRSEEALRAAEERTRLIIDTALDAVVTIDRDGVITHWSPQAERVFGWTREEAAGRVLADTIIPAPQREAHRSGLARFLATGEATLLGRRLELLALHREGREFPVEISVTPLRVGDDVFFTAFIRDITDRKQAEQRLHDQLERLNLLARLTRAIGARQDLRSVLQVVLRSLEDQLPLDFCCALLHDRPENCLVVAEMGPRTRPVAVDLAMPIGTRVPIDEDGLLRCVQGQLVYEPDAAQSASPFPQRLARCQLRSMAAAPLAIESNVFGVLIAARRQAGSFSSPECEFLQQLSEHVALAAHQAELHAALQRAYDDLRQTQQAIVQQERLRALGQMASGIAHDINNAISPVALYTESLLETEMGLSEQARDYLSTIQRAIDDVAQTVARLSEFYREREPQLVLRPVHINQIVQEVIGLTRARWSDMPQRRGLAIDDVVDLTRGDPTVLGVASQLREALTNLVFNSVDAMPAGGRLTVRTVVADAVRVEVVDTGIGMEAETRRRCLEPFFTTKGERGTGLGLAMVYGVVQRHNGDIEIESAPGQGTTIRLCFAAAPNASEQESTDEVFPRPPRLRILVVDDDPVLLKSLHDVLEGDGHLVMAANGGQAGIDLFRTALRDGRPFGVVITDLGMPHVDGRRVASTVKETVDATPVILLTGWGQGLVDDSGLLHVDRVLSKPPKLSDLRAALRDLTSAASIRIAGQRR